MAVDYLLIGLCALIVVTIGMFLIKLRAINLRLRILETQIKDMHIMTSRLLLRELNSPRVSRVGFEKPAHIEEAMPETRVAVQNLLPSNDTRSPP
jgi:hypothetical protein